MGRWYLGQLANGNGVEDAAFLDLQIQENADGTSVAAGLVVCQQPEMELCQRLVETARLKQVWKKLVRMFHPDLHKQDPEKLGNFERLEGRVMAESWTAESLVQLAMEYFYGKVTAMSGAQVFSSSESNDSAVHDFAAIQLLDPGDQRSLRLGNRETLSCWNSSPQNRGRSS